MADEKVAVYKNHSNLPQIFYDVVVGGVLQDRVRVLPGSKIELPTAFGEKQRKVLTRTKDAPEAAKAEN